MQYRSDLAQSIRWNNPRWTISATDSGVIQTCNLRPWQLAAFTVKRWVKVAPQSFLRHPLDARQRQGKRQRGSLRIGQILLCSEKAR